MLGSIIGGIGSIVGGLIGSSGAQSAGKRGARAAIRGAKINSRAARWASRQNLKYQMEFAKKGIRWRARDAIRAGIHPLAALGAQPSSFSPSFISGNPGDGMIEAGRIQASSGAAAAESMDQGIARAATAFGDVTDRNTQYLMKMQDLQLQNAQLNNAVLASQVANLNQPGNPPASPTNRWLVDGQGQTTLGRTPLIQDQPLKRVVAHPEASSQEPGSVTDVGFLRTASGGMAPVMSTDAKERLEEDWIGSLTWNLRNRILQNLQIGLNPPPGMKGAWYNPVDQSYHPGNDRADDSGSWFKKNSKGQWDFNW